MTAGSDMMAPEDVERAQALAREPRSRVTVDVLPTGHWVHTEDQGGLVHVLLER